MHKNRFLIFYFIIGFISVFAVSLQSHARDIPWDSVIKMGEAYFGSPTPENARKLYLALPDSKITHAREDDAFYKATQYFYGHLPDLKKHMSEDRYAVKIALRLLNISDGGFSEELYDVIGDLADTNPRLFLEEIRDSSIEIDVVCCGARLMQLYGEKTKREYNQELEKRIKTLESVNDGDLITIRDTCIKQIKRCLIVHQRGLGYIESLSAVVVNSDRR
jgi:hypothetical protein